MIHFSPLRLSDLPEIRPYYSYLPCRTCDYTPGGMFMWREYFSMEFAVENGTFFSRLHTEDNIPYYNIPLSPCPEAALNRLRELEPDVLRFCTVPEAALPLLLHRFPNAEVQPQRDYFDYLYRTEDLATLKGKKYAGQRNQISQFRRNHPQWSFLPLTPELIPAVKDFFLNRYLPSEQTASQQEENRMVLEVLDHPELYDMTGALLAAEDQILGFSLGEVQGDTLFVHIEKALRDCKGAYQLLQQQFAATYGPEDGFINREEDMGSPGLRTAKTACHPVSLLEKYTVIVR